MGAHGGFAKAVNRGIRESRTPLVAIVNNDVDLAPDWLEKLAAALEPGVWFATGRILQAAAPDRIDATYDALCRGGTPWRVGHACPGWAGVSRAAPDLVRAVYGRPVSRRIVPTGRAARRALRIVSGRRRFRTALCAGRLRGALRAGCGSLAPGQRYPGPLASGNHQAHGAQPGFPGRQTLFDAPVVAIRVAHRGSAGALGAGGCAARSRLAVGARQNGGISPVWRIAQRAPPTKASQKHCMRASGRSTACNASPAPISTGPCIFYSPRVGQSDTCLRWAS